MSSTAEWRKLADDHIWDERCQGALRAACDRVDELEGLRDGLMKAAIDSPAIRELRKRAEAAEAKLFEAKLVAAALNGRGVALYERAEKAEARVAELESHRAAAQHASINDCERAESAEVSLTPVLEALRAACDRVDELEASISAGSRRTLLKRAEAAEARCLAAEAKASKLSEACHELRTRAEAAEARVAELERKLNHESYVSDKRAQERDKAEASRKVAVEAMLTVSTKSPLFFTDALDIIRAALAKLREGET